MRFTNVFVAYSLDYSVEGGHSYVTHYNMCRLLVVRVDVVVLVNEVVQVVGVVLVAVRVRAGCAHVVLRQARAGVLVRVVRAVYGKVTRRDTWW